MDPITRAIASAAAGAAAAGEATYVDDVFSTYVYEGNGSTQSIDNGIDFSGEGGLVWIKRRDSTNGHFLVDTERGRASNLNSTSTSAAGTSSANKDLVSFNNNGFTVGPAEYENLNGSGRDFVSWSFRKAPGFFDVVTWTGNGSSQAIAHDLGSVPGFIMVKRYSNTEDWICYHRSLGQNQGLELNGNGAAFTNNPYYWNNTQPTSTNFTVGNHGRTNTNGETYVAYVFAHDDQSFGTNSDEAIIKCGSFTSDSSGAFNVNLGYEPQLVLIKESSGEGDWFLLDVIRGLARTHISTLRPNSTLQDINYVAEGYCYAYASGFASDTNFFGTSSTFIYMAIRRPHKPPTAGTEVFDAAFKTGATLGRPSYRAGFPIDMAIREDELTGSTFGSHVLSRLTGTKQLFTTSASVESNNSSMVMDYMNGFNSDAFDSTDTIAWMFKRAPGFFDVVTWSGNGSANRAINHNLGVIPELYITKRRTASENWMVTTDDRITSAKGFFLNTTSAEITGLSAFTGVSSPTSSVFYIGSNSSINGSGDDYIAYLFATLDGISKVGSYTGTGSAINVDCGFTAGARFVLIKRTDAGNSTTHWYVWDTTRGIVSGNDPYFLFNSTAPQTTSTDYIDPLNAGFTVTSSAPAALNTSGGTYLFLAIA